MSAEGREAMPEEESSARLGRSAPIAAAGHVPTKAAVRARSPLLALAAALAAIVIWVSLIRRFGEGDVYAMIGPYSLIATVGLLLLRRSEMTKLLRPAPRPIWIGIAMGILLTVLTYPAFQIAARFFPGLDSNVEALYAGARSTTLPRALVWATAAAIAEEVIFRGVLLDALSELLRASWAAPLSVLIYGAAQLGTGSLIVVLMALGYGSVWTIQRRLTGSLLSTIISHVIWTPIVLLLWPVT